MSDVVDVAWCFRKKKEKQMKPAILVRYRFICERKRLKRLKKRIEGHKVS